MPFCRVGRSGTLPPFGEPAMHIPSIGRREHGPPGGHLSSSSAARDLVVTLIWVSLLFSLIAWMVE
jgi:hypothetical protein